MVHDIGWKNHMKKHLQLVHAVLSDICTKASDGKNADIMYFFQKRDVTEDSQGQLHREQVSYAMHRGRYVVEDDREGCFLVS